MARETRTKLLVYHITALDNLESIFTKGLLSREALNGVEMVDVADPEILAKRKTLGLLKFVPFHFFSKNPFAWTARSNRPGHPFVYISVARALAKAKGYKILTKHPLAITTSSCGPFDFDEGYAKINWDHMDSRQFQEDDCKASCLAECLAPDKVIPSDFHSLYTFDAATKVAVERLKACHCPRAAFFVSNSPKMF